MKYEILDSPDFAMLQINLDRDEEIIAAANEHGIAMVFTGMRHFRH